MRNLSNKNITKLEKLFALAEDNGIPIDEHCPSHLVSISVRLPNGRKIIGISPESDTAEHTRLECMAHELGHCLTESFYSGYSPLELRAKHEYRADAWAIDRLIPFSALCQAIKDGCRERYELAEYFGVSDRFVEKALRLYEQRNSPLPIAPDRD